MSPGPRDLYQAHKDEFDDAIARVMRSGRYVLGPEVEAFEREFADWLGGEDAAGVANGTDAIEIALRAFDIGPGDSVITVSHTAVATVAAIERAGATPILVDIDRTYTMDLSMLAEALESRKGGVKAVVPVHLYGHPADMPSILKLCRAHGAALIEDCAQAHGATIDGKRVGTWGDAAAFSFYPTKNLGAFGDGGAVTGSKEVIEKVRALREYGWKERFISASPGVNSRLDPIQAAVLRVGLRHLESWNEARREIASIYSASGALQPPETRDACQHVFHQYVVEVDGRDALLAHLQANGVAAAIHYPRPVHLQPAYQGRVETGKLIRTEEVAGRILSLPIHPSMAERQARYVCELVSAWMSEAV